METRSNGDPVRAGRGRTLAILGGATLLFTALAIGAVWQRSPGSADTGAKLLFPGLAAQLSALGEIAIQTKDSQFHIREVEGKGWVVTERNDFPADPNAVHALVVGISSLETVEAKTARPELHAALGLVAPDKGGEAVRVSLADTAKKPLADVLVSQTREAPDAEGRNRLYVRKTGEDQSWLARGSLNLQPDIAAWLSKSIFTLTRERIQSASITPLTAPAFSVSRVNAEQAGFQLAAIPAGRQLGFPAAATNLATTITEFRFEDIRPVPQVDFTKASTLTLKTFDGLTLKLQIATADGAQWATIHADGAGDAAAKEAAAINAKADGWAFKLPEYLATALIPARDTLLKPPAHAAPAR